MSEISKVMAQNSIIKDREQAIDYLAASKSQDDDLTEYDFELFSEAADQAFDQRGVVSVDYLYLVYKAVILNNLRAYFSPASDR